MNSENDKTMWLYSTILNNACKVIEEKTSAIVGKKVP